MNSSNIFIRISNFDICEFTANYNEEIKNEGKEDIKKVIQGCGNSTTNAFKTDDINEYAFTYGSCQEYQEHKDNKHVEGPTMAIVALIVGVGLLFIGSCIYGYRLLAQRRKKNRQGRKAGGVYEEEAF